MKTFVSDKNLTLRDANGVCHHVSKGMVFAIDGRRKEYVNVPGGTISKDFYDQHFTLDKKDAPAVVSADNETQDED